MKKSVKTTTFFLIIIFITLLNYAEKYTAIYSFGDSLSSGGNNKVLTSTVWTEFLASSFANNQNTNYAFPGYKSWQIYDSINSYVRSNSIDPESLFTIWGGTNDSNSDPVYILNGIELLNNSGAKNILVLNLHDNPRRSRPLMQNFNNRLLAGISGMDANIILADAFSLFDEIYENPSLYGFNNTQEVLPDSLHLSTNMHAVLSDYIKSIVQAPSVISVIPEIPLSITENYQSLLFNNLNILEKNPEKTLIPLVSISSVTSNLDDDINTYGYDENAFNVLFGIGYSYSDVLNFGAALGKISADGDFSNDLASFDLDSTFFSIFLNYQVNLFKMGAAISKASFSFNSIERNIALGTAIRKEDGSADGDGTAIKLYLTRAIYQENGWFISPVLSYDVNSIDVDSYSEDMNNSTSMVFDNQNRDSNKLGLGIKWQYKTEKDFGSVSFFGDFTYKTDSENSETNLTSELKTQPGNEFDLPGFIPDRDSYNFLVGIQTNYKKSKISLTYLNENSSQIQTSSIMFTYKYFFEQVKTDTIEE